MKNEKNPFLKLRRQIKLGALKVVTIKGVDSGDCPSPKCTGGNAMICRGECPAGFEPHHFWRLGLELTACRDCGHSVIATRNPDWEMPSVAELSKSNEELMRERDEKARIEKAKRPGL